jgi:Tn3 transposase DDE domain
MCPRSQNGNQFRIQGKAGNFAILGAFGYQFAPRYRDIRDKMDTLSGFKHPSKYDAQFLLKPSSKANTKLILAEEDNIKHVFASLATKAPARAGTGRRRRCGNSTTCTAAVIC